MVTPVIEVQGLTKVYPLRGRGRRSRAGDASEIRAVDGVDLEVAPGEILALVGESGSGKTTLGKMITRLEKPTSGSVYLEGVDLARRVAPIATEVRRAVEAGFTDEEKSSLRRLLGRVAENMRVLEAGA